MLAKINSAATIGLDGVLIDVEVDVASRGLPSLSIVGLPDKAVEEAKDRVRTALHNVGTQFPPKKITINLAPADIPKEGPGYDLPIAVGILLAAGEFDARVDNSIFVGELSLDGSVRHAKGILPIVLTAKKYGIKKMYIPKSNAREAAVIRDIEIFPVNSLKELINHLTNVVPILPQKQIEFVSIVREEKSDFDMCDVHGQEQAKRALEIAAAGGHNVFMNGAPGSGKTMLARTFPTILPSLTEKESLEVTRIYSITGSISSGKTLITNRPFRSPHHTTSRIGLIGGGAKPKPGEISLAHRGVLFLDEFPEFPRHVLESLRQPIEDGYVQISRAAGTVVFPTKFTLIAAANPCPCGYFLSKKRECKCLSGNINRYQKKVSGPIIDRIDLHVQVSEVEISKLSKENTNTEKSAEIRNRVEKSRLMQLDRYSGISVIYNSELSTKQVKIFCKLEKDVRALLTEATAKLGLTARSYFKIIKISRTIADLDGEGQIKANHIAEALQYRPQQQN
ncbi:YifB family Mg chelatase-like AAA ATPase [Patescibacteria group bacterium]